MGAEMIKDEALKLALEALEFYYDLYKEKVDATVFTAINKALAQPEQEPVAMRYDFDGYGWLYIDNGSGSNWREKIKNAEPLFTAPPQPKPLTDKQIEKMMAANLETWNSKSAMASFVRTIETAHGIKGEE